MEQRKNLVHLNSGFSWDSLKGRTRGKNCSIKEEFGVSMGKPRGRGWIGRGEWERNEKNVKTWRQGVEKRQSVRSSRLWPKIFLKQGVKYCFKMFLQCKFLLLLSSTANPKTTTQRYLVSKNGEEAVFCLGNNVG